MKSHKVKTDTGEHSVLRMANAIRRKRSNGRFAATRKLAVRVHKKTGASHPAHKILKKTGASRAAHKTHKKKTGASKTHKKKTGASKKKTGASRVAHKKGSAMHKRRSSRKRSLVAPVLPVVATPMRLVSDRKTTERVFVAFVVIAVLAVSLYFIFRPPTDVTRTTKPDTTKPDTTKPDTTKPDTTKPVTTAAAVAVQGIDPLIIAGIFATVGVALFLAFTYLRGFFGGGPGKNSEVEEELLAELAIKSTSKKAPLFYELASEIANAVHYDKALTREQRDDVYKSLLKASKTGDPSAYKSVQDFAKLNVPQSSITTANVTIVAGKITDTLWDDKISDEQMNEKKAKALVSVPDDIRAAVEKQIDRAIQSKKDLSSKAKIELTDAQKVLAAAQETEDAADKQTSTGFKGLFGIPKTIRDLRDEKELTGVRIVAEGGPGLGKTESLKALMKERPDLHVIRLTAKDLGELRGQGAKKLSDAVKICEWYQQEGEEAILFLDEGDTILRDPELRTEAQTLLNNKKLNLFVTTNFYDNLPAPIKSRTRKVSFTMPSRAQRSDIIKFGLAAATKGEVIIEEGINFGKLAKRRLGGRDIYMALSEARREAENIARETNADAVVTQKILDDAFRAKYESKTANEKFWDRIAEARGK